MLLNPNLEIFRSVPQTFSSPFPSSDSRLSPKYDAIARAAGDAKGLASIGERLLCQQQAQAWRDGLALVNFAKATAVGDLLSESLSKVAWISKSGPAGLFAALSDDDLARVGAELLRPSAAALAAVGPFEDDQAFAGLL